MEISMEILQKSKNRTTIQSNYTFLNMLHHLKIKLSRDGGVAQW
jgi:hypothetical protein